MGTFLIGCAVLLVAGCAGVSSEAPQEEQGRTEATSQGQARSSEATASEEARCQKTRTFHRKNYLGSDVTNDLPGCPKGGPLSGTDKPDQLAGMDGDDEIRGLGDLDFIDGGPGNDEVIGGRGNDVLRGGSGGDVIDGGPGADALYGEGLVETDPPGQHEDVFRGGDGNDQIDALDGQRDELYCGGGWDRYMADESGDRYFANDKVDYVDSSCEKKGLPSVA